MSIDPSESTRTFPLPPKATLLVEGRELVAKGPMGEIRRSFPSDLVTLAIEKGSASIALRIPSRRREDKALLGTWAAHARNLAYGVTVGFEARLKVVAAHFPMKVQAKEGALVIENFLGEKHPRTASLRRGVKATVDGEFVTLSGTDIEEVGQSAANIERTTKIRDYDPRVFQDGIFLVDRAHPREARA